MNHRTQGLHIKLNTKEIIPRVVTIPCVKLKNLKINHIIPMTVEHNVVKAVQ